MFADTKLHSDLRSGFAVNGLLDLHDILECWDEILHDPSKNDGTVTPSEMEKLKSFDGFLERRYFSDPSFPGGSDWNWLYSRNQQCPDLWRMTVSSANHVLEEFGDFDILLWRIAKYRIW